MYPEVLEEHIDKTKRSTQNPFGVNVPLLYPDVETIMEIIIKKGVEIVFTSAGNPSIWTQKLKEEGKYEIISFLSKILTYDAQVAENKSRNR